MSEREREKSLEVCDAGLSSCDTETDHQIWYKQLLLLVIDLLQSPDPRILIFSDPNDNLEEEDEDEDDIEEIEKQILRKRTHKMIDDAQNILSDLVSWPRTRTQTWAWAWSWL